MSAANPPSERFDPPLYLARHRAAEQARQQPAEQPDDDGMPLYLRRFRQQPHARPDTPLWQRAGLEVQQALTEDNRNKEISAPPSAHRAVLNDVYLIRHGETQGYGTDSGLTPQGAWQAHTYGHTLAKRIKSGETVVFRHADTNRARETAEHIHLGLRDGIAQYEKDITVHEPRPMAEFANFQFVAPDGLKDVTAAFRQFQSEYETYERTSAGDRPLWLVVMDRFWRVQEGGGDPIQHWLSLPMVHFEPPAMAVRRFWRGICELSEQHPGARVAIATHSGCIRAFAVAALGYDPGEPYNTEHVRVKLYGTPRQPRPGMSATITYRNRVQEWKVPDPAALPTWGHEHEWRPVEITPTESDIGTDTSTRDDAPRELTYTLWFDEFDESHVHCIGGKNASLGAMTRAGLPVPAGFAVTTHAYTHSMAGEHVGQAAHTLLDGIDVHDLQQLAEAAEAARAAVLHAGPSPAVADSIRRAYRELCARTGVDDVPVAVRSSATAEDQPDASFAGQQDTYLWVRGEDAVVAHVARCWASLFTDRAIAYRHENGYPHAEVHMSVAVQQMVLPKAAGVAFTLDPTNGDRSTIAIDSAFGVGESVVSGAVTPDNYKVDKVIFEITQRTVSAKECECVLDGDTLVHRPLDAERSLTASLTDDEIRAVARLARQAEKHYGRPQDVEWAVTVGDDGSSAVHLLQSRPETVWSSKPRTAGNASKSAIDGIVDTLLTPVRVRPE